MYKHRCLLTSLRTGKSPTVYVESLDALGYFYQVLNHHLKELQYYPPHVNKPENRLFAQYHKEYMPDMKTHIIQEIENEDPNLRLVLATKAMGMGLNAPHIRRIIHCRPPTTLEKYAQEIGRAGRDGARTKAVLHYNNSDIATCKNRKGLSSAMAEFCKNTTSCLRVELVKYFGFDNVMFNGPAAGYCSNCAGTVKETYL
ncbi:ATP-dependent DNA helicase Q1-like [Argopecten irradians]|uniref:ATP-dependent DNA helicase Q1-like n=1 Tax=Argopecten irradians TaxID=31199 RepID=UPI00371EF576